MERAGRMVERIVTAASSIGAFLTAVAIVVVWGAAGPLLGFSSGWQLTINTGTTIVTFLVGFAILHRDRVESDEAKRRDKALHAKIDSLVEAVATADNRLVGLEDDTDERIDRMASEVRRSS